MGRSDCSSRILAFRILGGHGPALFGLDAKILLSTANGSPRYSMTFARLRGDNRKGSIMNMSLACRARACPAIAAGCRALRPTARNKASAACPAPSGMKSGGNRCFVDSLRWREVDLNHRFRAWTRFGFGLPDGHRGVSWLWKSPSRPTDSTGRDRAEVTAAQASQREIFSYLTFSTRTGTSPC